MPLNYVDYLNNLRGSISISFGSVGELLEAYKLTALLLINYAVMVWWDYLHTGLYASLQD